MLKINIAIIGFGAWGKNLARNFFYLNSSIYINDKNKFLAKHPIIKYKNLNYILKNKNINALVLATPINTHFDIAKLALKNKKDIFVEKPLTQSTKNINILKNLAKKNKNIIMVGHLLHYHKSFIKIRRLINSKYVGKIKKIYSIRTNNTNIPINTDITWDYAPHDLSMIKKINPQKEKNILITSKKYINNYLTEVNIQLNYNNNLACKIFLSWHNKQKRQKLKIIGAKKTLTFDDTKNFNKKIKINDTKSKIKMYIKVDNTEPLLNECRYFIEIIKRRKNPLTNTKESKIIINLIEQINASTKIIK